MPDAVFADPRLAAIYDDVDGDRTDLDHYEAIVVGLGARSVMDVGCGTGTFALRLAARGLTVIGVDPAGASLDVARAKRGAERVTWLHGEAATLAAGVDVVTMTGNVAQVFLDDRDWSAALSRARRMLRGDGRLLFETRDPSFREWDEWTPEQTTAVTETAAGGVEHWTELVDVSLPLVSFRHTFRFIETGETITSDSTLRFRDPDEITSSLALSGFTIEEIRDAPDRPRRELVVIARPTPA
jgi:SAM-dependent methyltransferase